MLDIYYMCPKQSYSTVLSTVAGRVGMQRCLSKLTELLPMIEYLHDDSYNGVVLHRTLQPESQ